jgi:ketosteroid isomerase-like protein
LVTSEEVEQATRDWIAAYNSGDVAKGAALETTGVGFGYRSRASRNLPASGSVGYIEGIRQWYAQHDALRITFEELHTSVDGDIGVAWGVYIEEFQERGRPAERARVRFSQALRKDASGWHFILFHRDIQPFDDDGRYLRTLTTA